MGMMLRRNNRKPDYTPTVNGKPVVKQPKNRSLTDEKTKYIPTSTPTYSK